MFHSVEILGAESSDGLSFDSQLTLKLLHFRAIEIGKQPSYITRRTQILELLLGSEVTTTILF